MTVGIDPRVSAVAAEHPRPLLFATISGAHLYGFPSPDSDFDLRGVHILPLEEVVGLERGEETIERAFVRDGLEMDLVTHDAEKFFGLLLKKNGYVLEQLHSPLVVVGTPEFEELREIARGCVTRFHFHHYLGFFNTQWHLFEKETPPRAKPLLYVYRVLLTGIHLMRTGIVEANLRTLNEEFALPWIEDLILRKTTGTEKVQLSTPDVDFHRAECSKLVELLKVESERSTLPEHPTARPQLHDLLVRIRLRQRA